MGQEEQLLELNDRAIAGDRGTSLEEVRDRPESCGSRKAIVPLVLNAGEDVWQSVSHGAEAISFRPW